MGYSCRTLLRDTLVRHSSGTLLRDTLVGLSSSSPDTPHTTRSPVLSFQLPRYSTYYSCTTRSPVLSFQLHRLLRVLKLYYKVASSQLPAPQIAPRTKVVLPSHQFSSSSSPDTPRTKVVLQSRQCSPAFRALDTHDLRRGLRGHRTNRTLACISRTRHARSPQRVARAWDKSHSRLHFAHSTRTISAEGCASSLQNERFVRDFLKNSHVQVCKTSVSYETSSKRQAETPIGAHTSRSPAKQFRDSSPSRQHPLTRQSQWDSDIHLYHNSQPHDSLRLPRIFPHPRV